MFPGISVVICCHNSAKRLSQTLAHLAAQQISQEIEWEVVLVDNASTDETVRVALDSWPLDAPAPLRVVSEPSLGLSYARQRGLAESRHDIISFVDDDNWVSPNWVELVSEILGRDPTLGACGGQNEAVCEAEPPDWFDYFKGSYAVGAQAPEAGDVTWTRGWLWGAGLSIRKSAWSELSDRGYSLKLVGRKGGDLSSAEDMEICYALRLGGWRLLYEPALTLQHFVPSSRMTWNYLRRLMRSNGKAAVALDAYTFTVKGAPEIHKGRLNLIWTWQTKEAFNYLFQRKRKVLRAFCSELEGDPEVIKIEFYIGRLFQLLQLRSKYDRRHEELYRAPWRRPGVEPSGKLNNPQAETVGGTRFVGE